jgi:chromosome partitioning protein
VNQAKRIRHFFWLERDMKPIIFSVMNHKGGVGKTTTAVNLVAGWAENGKRILLIDNDPQGSAGLSLGVSDDGQGLLKALSASTPLPVVETEIPELYLVPSGPGLVEARRRFSGALGLELLRRCLQRTPGDWDRVVIDCPLGEEILTVGALRASRYVLIPVEIHFLGLNGINQILKTGGPFPGEGGAPGARKRLAGGSPGLLEVYFSVRSRLQWSR